MNTIRIVKTIDFDVEQVLDMCRVSGFPDVEYNYGRSYDGEETEIYLYLEKDYNDDELERDSEVLQGLSDSIGELDGVYTVEDSPYMEDMHSQRVKLTIGLGGLMYNEHGEVCR